MLSYRCTLLLKGLSSEENGGGAGPLKIIGGWGPKTNNLDNLFFINVIHLPSPSDRSMAIPVAGDTILTDSFSYS